MTEEATPQRIAKVISRAGLCSRRDAERWIAAGRVKVNGTLIDTPAMTVTKQDRVEVDGALIGPPPEPTLWLYHKPVDLITTHNDPEGRTTVFETLPPECDGCVSVGRLDINSEGLLLLTNHGEISRYLELPSTGWTRTYRLRIKGTPTPETLRALKKGVEVDGITYGSISAKPEAERTGANQWVTTQLAEGKNRELRKVFSHFGHPVSRLIRVSYGPFQLGKLAPGEVKQVSRKVLRNALGEQMMKKISG